MESKKLTPQWSGKRRRTAFTNAQLEFLQKAYERNKYPAPSDYSQLGNDSGLGAVVVRTWFCNTRASKRKHFKPTLLMDDQDKEFFNYLARNQPQILPFFHMVPWQPKTQPASNQGNEEFHTCLTNPPEARSQQTKTDHNVLPSTSQPKLNPNVVQTSYGSLSEHKQQPVPPTPSNFAVVQHQQVGNDPLLAFRQSTGGGYHALCDAVGIDRLDPQTSALSVKPGNLRPKSNGITSGRVHNFQKQRMYPEVSNGVLQSLGDGTRLQGAWIANGQPTMYRTPVRNSAHFVNDSNKQPRNNSSKFSDEHRSMSTNGQNGLSDPRWSRAMQYLDNWDELLNIATNATDRSIDYLKLPNSSRPNCY